MPYSIGKSFQPGAEAQNGGARGGPNQSPVQSAIKLLSLRLPSVVGARALAPQALLQSPGGAGVGGGDMGVDAVIAMLRRLMQQSGGDGGPQTQGLFGGPSMTTSDWLLDETNLGPREPRQAPTSLPPPRVIPSQSPGEGDGPSGPRPTIGIASTPTFDYNTFDTSGYQQYQAENPDNPISPWEYQNR